MTKPKPKSERMAALEQLSAAIQKRLLNAGPDGLTVPEVAEGLGFSFGAIRVRLDALLEAGRVYRERHTQLSRSAIYYTWHSIDVPAQIVAPDAPRRIMSRTYPIVGRRDELVAALFGHAGSAA
jgi:hypothetical protein